MDLPLIGLSEERAMRSLEETTVAEVMITSIVTVQQSDSLSSVARVLETRDINAAPVVDEQGKCVGIITSHDLVEYESRKADSVARANRRVRDALDILRNEWSFHGSRYDEAGFHMSRNLESAEPDDLLSEVAQRMCERHIHHIVVLDSGCQPVGILSSLDLIGLLIGRQIGHDRSGGN